MNVSVADIVADEGTLGVFLLVSVLIGGGAAWIAGRAIAASWRPWWHIAGYMALLCLAVRFLHFALFQESFLSPDYFLLDYVVCLAFALLGFRLMRVRQMVNRYSWINARAGLFRWRRRDQVPVEDNTKTG
jgi:hypothetical protein